MYKTLTSLAFTVAFAASINAQLGLAPQWQTSLENSKGISAQAFYDAITTSTGGVYVGLRSSSSGGNAGISSLSPTGQINWETSLNTGTHQGSIGRQVETDATGNFYIRGTQTRAGFMDEMFLAKVDATGNQVWGKTYYGALNKSAEAFDLKVTANAVYICGSEKDTSFYKSGFLLKFDLAGNLLWSKTYSTGKFNEFFSMAIDGTGNIVVAGTANSDKNSLVVKYNPQGNVLWQYPTILPNRTEEQYLNAVTVDASGNIFATGAEEQNSSFIYDVITLKLSTTGSLGWQQNWNNADENDGLYIKVGANGTIYVGANKEDNFDYYALLIAYNTTGTKLWENDFEFDKDATIEGMELDASDNIYIAIQDYDSVGVAKFSSSGSLIGSKSYSELTFEYLDGMAVGANGVLLCGRSYVGNDGIAASLTTNLSQNYFKNVVGAPLSYAKAGALATNTTHTYSATFSDDGDTAGFDITQMDASTGNVNWTKTKRHKSFFEKFDQIVVDGNGAVIGLYEYRENLNALGIVKYSASGNEVFSTVIDSAGPQANGRLTVDASGNIYVAGYRQSIQQMYLRKYDPTGLRLWEQTYTGISSPPSTQIQKLIATPQGKVVLCAINGQSGGNAQFEIFQYSGSGQLEWNKPIGSVLSSGAVLTDMLVDAQGNITSLCAASYTSYLAEKLDATSTSVWSKSGAMVSSQFPRSLAMDGNGNSYLCFSSNSNYTIRKVDNSGTIVQDKNHTFKSSGAFYFPWYAAWTNGHLAILGRHIIGGGQVPFQALLDANADVVSFQVDSTTIREVIGGATDGTGAVYGIYSQSGSALSRPWYKSQVLRFNVDNIGLPENGLNPSSILVYPNPVRTKFTVQVDQDLILSEAVLYDIYGRKLHSFSIASKYANGSLYQFALPSGLTKGSYLLRLTTPDKTVGKVILIE